MNRARDCRSMSRDRNALSIPFTFPLSARSSSFSRARAALVAVLAFGACWTPATMTEARPGARGHEFSEPTLESDRAGSGAQAVGGLGKAALDTIWIADWTFDAAGGACDFSGWERFDNHVRNDGVQYWDLDSGFDGFGDIAGTAAALGYENDLCCAQPNGYDNDWYQAIRVEYTGAATLSFDYFVDAEDNFDFLQVESDSGCASFDRVDYALDPYSAAAAYRTLHFSDSGLGLTGAASDIALTNHGPGTHCVYIAFSADGAFSPCDGLQSITFGKALVVDNIVINDAGGTRSEDFEDGSNDIGVFANIQDTAIFGPPSRNGSWARVYPHVTDNDFCTENTTCAVLWTDDTTPTIASDPSMAFGPGGYVTRKWLDDIIVSPWVSLANAPSGTRTILRFRRFPGNFFSHSKIVQNWSVRAKVRIDDGMGGTTSCASEWGHALRWDALGDFQWLSLEFDMSTDFDPNAFEIQIRHRVSDWNYIASGGGPPRILMLGPGPYIDRTRIGRVTLTGPVITEGIDSRSQAQDAFATEIDPLVSPGTGEHFRPTTNRFGTAAFSRGGDIASATPNLVTGDSVTVEVQDVRGAGGITRVEFYGTIVSGPHRGLAPPPHNVGPNGFFVVSADTARTSNGSVVDGQFFVDLDDTYFVGGDVLHYVWLAKDALGGFASEPAGLTDVPSSVDEVQAATNGMYEASFLPAIAWDIDFLAAVAANNKVDPLSDATFLDQSSQSHQILYVNRVNTRRRSGPINRTSFMFTMNRLGYEGPDVYDHSGIGNTNNHLGGRATVEQAEGYELIVYDAGNVAASGTILPDGGSPYERKIDQSGWFQSWLAQASGSEVGRATLWILGSNVLEANSTSTLYTNEMGTTFVSPDQGVAVNPDVVGQSSFTFDLFDNSSTVDFTQGTKSSYSLDGGCPDVRNYDALQATGSAVNVYRYEDPYSTTVGNAAIVMNSNPAGNTNTIFQSHPWFDIEPHGPVTFTPEEDLANLLLGLLTNEDVGDPTDREPSVTSAPGRSRLHRTAPNPFNPTTMIRFDLAVSGRVRLTIYDVAGRVVRTLIDQPMTADRMHGLVWDGRDDRGRAAASGVYLLRMVAPDRQATQRLVLLR